MELTEEAKLDIQVAVESLKDDIEHGWNMTTQKDKIALLKYIHFLEEVDELDKY